VEVRDIVNSNLLAMEKGAEGIFNIGTGVATSVNELARQVINAVDKEVDLGYAPPPHGEILHSLADTSRAATYLSFKPAISIEEGVRSYVSWFAAQDATRAFNHKDKG
jgi:UDP-glucose 4-epimerase